MLSQPALINNRPLLNMTAQISPGDKLSDILVALIILRQQRQTINLLTQRITLNPEIGADNRLDSKIMGLLIKAHQTAQVHLIGDCHSWHIQCPDLIQNRPCFIQAIHHRKVTVYP